MLENEMCVISEFDLIELSGLSTKDYNKAIKELLDKKIIKETTTTISKKQGYVDFELLEVES